MVPVTARLEQQNNGFLRLPLSRVASGPVAMPSLLPWGHDAHGTRRKSSAGAFVYIIRWITWGFCLFALGFSVLTIVFIPLIVEISAPLIHQFVTPPPWELCVSVSMAVHKQVGILSPFNSLSQQEQFVPLWSMAE